MKAKSTLRTQLKSLLPNKRLKRSPPLRVELVEPMDVGNDDYDYDDDPPIEPMDIEYEPQPQSTQIQSNPQPRHHIEIAVSVSIVTHDL